MRRCQAYRSLRSLRGGAAPRPVRLDRGEGLAASLLVAFGQAFDVVHAVAGFPVECAVAEEVRVAFGARADFTSFVVNFPLNMLVESWLTKMGKLVDFPSSNNTFLAHQRDYTTDLIFLSGIYFVGIAKGIKIRARSTSSSIIIDLTIPINPVSIFPVRFTIEHLDAISV